ncbi:hypothetical protein WA158_005078 [Blastocystis sp. Blastoise]
MQPKGSPFSQQVKNSQSSGFNSFVAGLVGGITGALCTCPLEVIKTRYQSGIFEEYKGFSGVFRGIYDIGKTEGIHGLWRGGFLMAISVAPSRAIHFYVYENSKDMLKKYSALNHISSALISSLLAGSVAVTATCPIWVIKTRIQLNQYISFLLIYLSYFNHRGIKDITREIYKEAGMKGFFKGLNASYLGLSETAIQFTMYEYIKSYSDSVYKQKGKETPKWRSFLDAALSKLIATLCTYPHEVVRTRLRQNGASRLWNCFVTIYKEEGLKALYAGCYAHVLRVVPNAAIMFLTAELIMGRRV